MSFNGSKVRAARALIDWSLDDLARYSGVNANTLINIEQEKSNPKASTVKAILDAFAKQGVILTARGVERVEHQIESFHDFLDILADAASVLGRNDEICFHCADDRRSSGEVTAAMNALEKNGVRLRFTYAEGNRFFSTSPGNYRWIDPVFFATAQVQVIYADRFVIHIPAGDDRAETFLMIRNSHLAAAMRQQFDYWWKRGEPCRDTEQ